MFSAFIFVLAAEGCLLALLKFLSGLEILSGDLILEVRSGEFPRSKTCFQTLRIPGHFKYYEAFKNALEASISTVESGFGLH